MTKLIFNYYHKHHSGRTMTRVCTTGFYGITFNLFAEDDSDFCLPEGSIFETEINAEVARFDVYSSEEDYDKANPEWDCMSVNPYGALLMFSIDENGNPIPQEAGIGFSGTVKEVQKDGSSYRLSVETLDEMRIHLNLEYEGLIETGYLIHADADLSAVVVETEK